MTIDKNKLNTFITSTLNCSNAKNITFYDEISKKICELFKNTSVAIFITQDEEYKLYSGIKNNQYISKDYSIKIDYLEKIENTNFEISVLKTKEDVLLYQNTMVSYLEINGSVFGFVLASSNNEFDQDDISSFKVISCILSYKIKDFELANIYKIQLKALQDAIIDKENAYEVIKKQHKKMKELDKAKNLFLANISHELRTPLNAIIGFSQALSAQIFGTLNDKQTEYIKDIQISSLHLLGMINEILDISKLEANAIKFNPNEINPNSSIQEVITILEPLYKNKNINVDFSYDKEIKIYADIQKFQQIIYNLLSNAIKFTNNNGKIEIKSYSKNKNYYLEVKDDGIGIDKKNHNKIFRKYVHLENNNTNSLSSTGLGLTITKELAKLHNGKITLISALNQGSIFKIEFKNIIK